MSPPTSPQVVASAGNPSEYFLCEEKVPLLKERCEVKRCAQHRPLAPEEEVVRLVSSWNTEEGYVGRICLKTREEVRSESTNTYIYTDLRVDLISKKELCSYEKGKLLFEFIGINSFSNGPSFHYYPTHLTHTFLCDLLCRLWLPLVVVLYNSVKPHKGTLLYKHTYL